MKLAGFVVLGIVVSIIVYYLVVFVTIFWLEESLPFLSGEPEASLWFPFLVILPFSLLLGGMVTGFLSCPELNTRWGLLGIAPGLYLGLLTFSLFFVERAVYVLLFWFFLYVVSLAGAGLGYFLRNLSRRRINVRTGEVG
ncbi:MAG: hypothetical protein ACYS8Y_04300 [Planctomycetota bacterium]|jgi:hypothetical protein